MLRFLFLKPWRLFFFDSYEFVKKPRRNLNIPYGNLRLLKIVLERSIESCPDSSGDSRKQIAHSKFRNDEKRADIRRINRKLALDLRCDNLPEI